MSDPPAAREGAPTPATNLAPGHTHCANCGAELLGPYCYRCGQPAKNLLKHLPALAADATDAIFNIDGRIMRTLPALFLRPGFLAREYFAGRRMRYVPPFRLMFFMSVLAFLLIRLAIMLDQPLVQAVVQLDKQATPAAVRATTRTALANIQSARNQPDMPAVGALALDLAAHAIPTHGNQRLRELNAAPLAATSVPAPPSTTAAAAQLAAIADAPSADVVNKRADAAREAIATSRQRIGEASPAAIAWLEQLDQRVDKARRDGLKRLRQAGPAAAPKPQKVPRMDVPGDDSDALAKVPEIPVDNVHVSWLPAFANARLAEGMQQARTNVRELTHGSHAARQMAWHRVLRNALSVLPPVLFVLMPIVALLLKLMYALKSRLYIEHLIVTLYSHAFIFTTLFVFVALRMIGARAGFLQAPLHWLEGLLWIWLPIYLFLMQKRVYAQGWFVTVLKYGVIGACYVILLFCALVAAGLIGLAQ